MTSFSRALVLFAHPDDAEFMCGGTVAEWVGGGTEIHFVCATDGSAGSNDPKMTREAIRPIREEEQRAAADVLGVAGVEFLGFIDGELECSLALRRAVTREVRRRRPDVIVAPDPSRLWVGDFYVNHPDHKAAGEAALCAVMPDAPSRPQFPELLDEGFEPFEVPALWLAAEDADTFVDIGSHMETKLKALACHVSQRDNGMNAEKLVYARAKHFGKLGGMEYAEGFRTFTFAQPEEE